MSNIDEIIAGLERIGIVPVIKLEDTGKAVELADALRKGGINAAEVTFRADGADEVIKSILKAFPDMLVGAGTVLTKEHAEKAAKSGAKFMVAPGLNPNIIKRAQSLGVPFIPGVSSSSEIEQAMELGLSYVKFFPAEQAGGISYIKAISAPYSQMRFMPTGGVSEANLNDYLAFEKVFACGGSWMVAPELIGRGAFSEITALSRNAVNKMLGFELAHVGVNCADESAADGVSGEFCSAFGFQKRAGNSSIFAGAGIEVMKSKYLGDNGHIAIRTNSVLRAVYALESRGYSIDRSTAKFDAKGRTAAVYLKNTFGGFAVHLVQK